MRPEFHFTAASGWINDPHGITYRDGEYHAFFQYVPERTDWAPNCHWGHARGADLLSLRELPIAIAPGEGDGGIWTGSLVTADDGLTRIFYTSTSEPDFGIGRIRVATPDDDDWISWSKGAVVAVAPSDLNLIAYRDPFLREDPDGWRMFVGAGAADGTAMALSYRSDNLEAWEYEGVALSRSTSETEDVWMGALWECPQIFDIDGRSVMVSSVWDDDVLYYAGYAVGTYTNGTFTATHWGRLTYGDSYYAPSLFRDADGRPCLSFWMRGVADKSAGWASAHSVPYLLTLDGDTLVASPHPDLENYRTGAPAGDFSGLAAEMSWSPDDAGLSIESGGQLVVSMGRENDELTIAIDDREWKVPYSGEVRIIVDGPVLEVSSARGLFGSAISPQGLGLTVRSADSKTSGHALSR
ncbi:glycoside hydrolase family 32 protein [Microbacterium sp. cx-59]|uniref:glycoside hydrolase family 32 protein n=1 Tax=Microbacterium sp. cx-59 TaxID=2891207 RepID=UPI001E2FB55B|nr:glycoside hydrolase family 32 protein [Microbacterium sp. cx-59]MCC4907687.1 glycoside hydrolase family 32 protein [Microbacterium sp. cx-59]